MNIIHHSSERYVPNQLFNHHQSHQNEYIAQTIDFAKQQKQSPTIENKIIKTKLSQTQNSEGVQLKFKSAESQKVRINDKQNHLILVREKKFSQDSERLQQFPVSNNKENKPKLKAKKKVSPKKNNFKQIFLQIDENAKEQYKICQNNLPLNDAGKENQQFDKSSNQNCESQISRESKREHIVHKNQEEPYIKSIEAKNISDKNQIQSESTSRNEKSLFKVNKFHFLHNQLNFDTSSDQESQKNSGSLKRSQSSQNQGEKIMVQMPKMKSRNFFTNTIDLDQDSEDQKQSNEVKASQPQNNQHGVDEINQHSENNESINQQEKVKSHSRSITVSDFRRQYVQLNEEYLKKSLPNDVHVDLIVKRDKSKRHSDFIEYQIYDGKSLKNLVTVVKKSSIYQIYAKTNVQNPKAHPDLRYLTAVINVSFLGNDFGLKYVKKSERQCKQSEDDQIAATISYETNILGFNGPRKINIYIPQNDKVKYYGDKSLQKLYEKRCMHKIDKYVNKQAKWNKQVQSYVLNLKGKAKLSSVKNFVIIKDEEEKEKERSQNIFEEQKEQKSFVVFGKVSKDIFNLNISGPFSILQGISIALSTFDRKLTCE